MTPRRRPGKRHITLVASALAVLCAAPAWAASTPPFVSPRSSARLLTDVDQVAQGQPFRVALELTAAPGWHTYWHNPGDAGAATRFDLTSSGLIVGGIAWPLPRRIADASVMSFGYTGTVMLVRPVTTNATGTLTLTATASWLVCQQLCVPEHASFTLTLPTGPAVVSAERAGFDAAARSVPTPAPWPARISADGTLALTGVSRPGQAVFLPDASDTTVLDATQPAQVRDGRLLIHLTPTAAFRSDVPMTGVLVLGDGDHRTGYRLTALPAAAPAAARKASPGWSPVTLLLALAGGLVLNLMPCVFPVLAMKAMSLARLGGAHRSEVRLHAGAYTAGVLLSCLLLALLMLGLRAAGAAAGWGFQFQYPAFVAAMAWLFFAIGLNLSGVFTLSTAWAGAGQTLAMRGGAVGSFATGLLAVLVATPCTAPFMGVAIAAAAAAPALQAIALFLALGVGFSLPWTLLAVAPRLARALPAPGLWMATLQQALAFPMYAAAVWMVWVLAEEAGPDGVLAAGAGCVLIALALWLARLGAGRTIGRAAAMVALLATAALLPAIAQAPHPMAESDAERYTPDRLAALRGQGQPVLVNMTAAWCVTCLVNERAAIAPALPKLQARGVAYLAGDWTRQDPDITAFLRQYGRDGVPLYVFFPAHQDGRVLPQILTPGVLMALGK
jgi:thiol:disulfide interchange protein DsbD